MITLMNGHGQLGSKLNELYKQKPRGFCEGDAIIYHTWNIDDKSENSQKKEYNKFIDFVGQNKHKKIIFISTYSQKENFYNHYKQLAGAYLVSNCDKALVIKLPTIIGKGVCRKIKNKEVKAYGEMELISLNKAAEIILEHTRYEGFLKFIEVEGEKVRAKLVEAILHET